MQHHRNLPVALLFFISSLHYCPRVMTGKSPPTPPYDDNERYRILVEAVIDYAIYMLDPNGTVSSWNAGARRFKGYEEAEILGQHFSGFYTEKDRQAGIPQLALETARNDGRFECEGWRVRKNGERFWAHVVIDPIRDETGELLGFAKITRDVTSRKKREDARQALIREIDHRTKNVLAVVQSLVRQTPFRHKDQYVEAVSGRVSAIARAHSILSENGWAGADLAELVRQELSPFAEEGLQFVLDGPRIQIRAQDTQPLGLILHELATNAAIHGALSLPTGRLSVQWRMTADGELQIDWSEADGPTVTEPECFGFGSTLVAGALGQLDGKLEQEWRPEGLRCLLTFSPRIVVSGES